MQMRPNSGHRRALWGWGCLLLLGTAWSSIGCGPNQQPDVQNLPPDVQVGDVQGVDVDRGDVQNVDADVQGVDVRNDVIRVDAEGGVETPDVQGVDAQIDVIRTDGSDVQIGRDVPPVDVVGDVPDGCRPSTEVCNNRDDDCDGMTDEDQGTTSCGMGACARVVQNCIAGVPQECTPGTSNPEECNAVDDDCDGTTDNGIPDITCGVGGCQKIVAGCVNGTMGICTPNPMQAETCNDIDDDCDGMTDEQLGQTSCGMGACLNTVQNCVGGMPQNCTPLPAQTEVCNGVDDDCDGSLDNGLGSTSCGVGACRVTIQNCVGGLPQSCTPGSPTTELCNNRDDDCDGSTDNNLPATITCGIGACTRIVQNCVAGVQGVCVPLTGSAETCNNADDDCDGMTDEMDPGGGGVCATMLPGACAVGVRHCIGGTLTCVPNILPGTQTETCNAADDDCDNVADNGNPGSGMLCTPGATACSGGPCRGVCARGSTNCVAGTTVCTPGTSATEICDGLDNDCDGTTDETDSMGRTTVTCGVGACMQTYPACTNGMNTSCMSGMSNPETCNGRDDDCNGSTDDGLISVLCPGTQQNVMTKRCSAAPVCGTGTCCNIQSCNPGYYDLNGTYTDGCECADTGTNTTACTATNLGTLTSGSTSLATANDRLVPAAAEDWYSVNFTENFLPPAPRIGTPTISFALNTGGIFVFDLFSGSSCSNLSARGCGSGSPAAGTATGLTSWTYSDNCTAGNCYVRFRSDWPSTVYIKVRRTTAGIDTGCASYRLNVTR